MRGVAAELGLVRWTQLPRDRDTIAVRRRGDIVPRARNAPAAAEVLIRQVRMTGKAVFEDPSAVDAEAGPAAVGQAAVGVPIRRHGRVVGVVYVERTAPTFPRQILSVLAWFAQMLEVEMPDPARRFRWRTVDIGDQRQHLGVA